MIRHLFLLIACLTTLTVASKSNSEVLYCSEQAATGFNFPYEKASKFRPMRFTANWYSTSEEFYKNQFAEDWDKLDIESQKFLTDDGREARLLVKFKDGPEQDFACEFPYKAISPELATCQDNFTSVTYNTQTKRGVHASMYGFTDQNIDDGDSARISIFTCETF